MTGLDIFESKGWTGWIVYTIYQYQSIIYLPKEEKYEYT